MTSSVAWVESVVPRRKRKCPLRPFWLQFMLDRNMIAASEACPRRTTFSPALIADDLVIAQQQNSRQELSSVIVESNTSRTRNDFSVSGINSSTENHDASSVRS